jgi:hypothetical protein
MKYLNLYLMRALLATVPLLLPSVCAAQQSALQDPNVVVIYDLPLDNAAREIIRIYPELKLELEELFEWGLGIRPQVLLVGDTRAFQKITGNSLLVAFAVPEEDLIVIDYSRMNIHPFTLNITLKHELCHLLLHQNISRENLPKWLDEGICQWASDGIGELFVNQNLSGLDAAVMSGRIIPFKKLAHYFPRDKASLMLAYEQSKSVIGYIERQYGNGAILSLLDHLKNGDSLEEAATNRLGISLDRLEKQWLDHLESTPRWLVFLANNIYGILFFLAAILTFLGFVRLLRHRKRVYEEWEEDEN